VTGNVRAFTPSRDFSAPAEPEPVAEEIEEEEDDRLSPDEVARLIDAAVATARQEGFEEGKAEGAKEASEDIAAKLETEVSALHGELQALRAREEQLFTELESKTARLMLALVHQLAKRLSEAEAKRLAEDVTLRAVEAVRGRHKITIRASTEFLDPLRQVMRLGRDEDAAAHRISFEPREDASAAPLEVAWLTGKVTFDPYAFTGEIDEVFTDTLKTLTGGEGNPSAFGESDE
jgi:hypothetical protein